MRHHFIPVLALSLALSGAAYAQSASGSSSTSGSTSNQQSSAQSSQQLATAQKIKHDLESAGFTDVNIVAESFVIRAKSKSGDPVLMTIGPHGMSVFETLNTSSSGGGSNTGSANSGSSGGTAPSNSSQRP